MLWILTCASCFSSLHRSTGMGTPVTGSAVGLPTDVCFEGDGDEHDRDSLCSRSHHVLQKCISVRFQAPTSPCQKLSSPLLSPQPSSLRGCPGSAPSLERAAGAVHAGRDRCRPRGSPTDTQHTHKPTSDQSKPRL